MTLTDRQVAALLWHVEVAEFRAIARATGPGRTRSLNQAELVTRPAEVMRRLDRFFELGLPVERTRDAASDAEPRAKTRPDPAIDAVVDWSYGLCPETPRGDPVGMSLMTP